MGEQQISDQSGDAQAQAFMRALLCDVEALARLLEADRLESGIRRIGAEQEMFLVDRHLRPAPRSIEVLERAGDERLTTELARFNLEANLTPRLFTGGCLRQMESELREVIGRARAAARALGAEVLLTGILPTLRAGDLGLENLTPKPRYAELNRSLRQLRGGDFHVQIHGLDALETTHDNILLESCNTSFQVHLQVGAEEFAPLYNLAQAITAPILAAAANSPLLFGHRLWHETRIALFETSVDTRSSARAGWEQKPRVHFGDGWVKGSVLDLFREDIARFRMILTAETGEDPLSAIARGEVPDLKALRVHNGTVYRWNRPCYGVARSAGETTAHLRIESRALPAGPTLLDEMANAALFYGLMHGLPAEHPRIDEAMSFEDAKANFFAAARFGLKAQLTWAHGRTYPASALLLEHLLPRAREGLSAAGIDAEDIDRYLGVIEERVRSGKTGAQWALGSLAGMGGAGTSEMRCRALAAAMLDHQRGEEEADAARAERPVHTWADATLGAEPGDVKDCFRTVGQFMSTDLFTVRPNDIVDFAASVMEWRHIRHVPVQDDEGRLVGVVSHRALLWAIAQGALAAASTGNGAAPRPTIASILHADPVTVTPETTTLEAIRVMREHDVGCLPVVAGGRLVGIISERDLLEVAAKLLESGPGEG